MLGPGWVSTSRPLPCSTSPPASSNSAADTPGSARVTEPGLVLVRPGSGEIMIAPVSVCHQVSTIGQRPAPMTVWYIPDLIPWQLAVEQQRRSRGGQAEHIDPVPQPEVMTAAEARLLPKVRRRGRLRPEPQVRHGLRARLLRVVDEVPLRVQVLLGAEDLDRVLVRADRAVRAEAEEDRADRAGRLDVQRPVIRQAPAGTGLVGAHPETGR